MASIWQQNLGVAVRKQLNVIAIKSESYQDSTKKCNDILFMLFYL